MKYKDYPNAPKATGKSKFLGYLAAWPFVLFIAILTWDIFRQFITMRFNSEKAAASFMAIIAALFVCGLLMKFKAFLSSIIDNQAILEASANNLPAYDAEYMALAADTKGKILKAGNVFIALGCLTAVMTVCSLPYDAEDIRYSQSGRVQVGHNYFVKQLYVLDRGYAQDEDSSHVYYLAAFGTNSSNELYLLSFDPGAKSKARRRIDEFAPSELCTLSVYVRISGMGSDLSKYYANAVQDITDVKVLYMNAEYICSEDESIALHSIGKEETCKFVIAGILVLIGVYFVKGAKNS